jgi:hypothetical protein
VRDDQRHSSSSIGVYVFVCVCLTVSWDLHIDREREIETSTLRGDDSSNLAKLSLSGSFNNLAGQVGTITTYTLDLSSL